MITEEYIQCFKKGLAQLSQMGDFIFQVDLLINSQTTGCFFFFGFSQGAVNQLF